MLARDIPGTVFKNGTAVLLARVVDADGLPLLPNSVAAAEYSISALDDRDPDAEIAVAAHTAQSLDTAEILYPALQRDPMWTVDDEGYNFRHVLDVSTEPAFAKAGVSYRIRYDLTPIAGQVIVLRFCVRGI